MHSQTEDFDVGFSLVTNFLKYVHQSHDGSCAHHLGMAHVPCGVQGVRRA